MANWPSHDFTASSQAARGNAPLLSTTHAASYLATTPQGGGLSPTATSFTPGRGRSATNLQMRATALSASAPQWTPGVSTGQPRGQVPSHGSGRSSGSATNAPPRAYSKVRANAHPWTPSKQSAPASNFHVPAAAPTAAARRSTNSAPPAAPNMGNLSMHSLQARIAAIQLATGSLTAQINTLQAARSQGIPHRVPQAPQYAGLQAARATGHVNPNTQPRDVASSRGGNGTGRGVTPRGGRGPRGPARAASSGRGGRVASSGRGRGRGQQPSATRQPAAARQGSAHQQQHTRSNAASQQRANTSRLQTAPRQNAVQSARDNRQQQNQQPQPQPQVQAHAPVQVQPPPAPARRSKRGQAKKQQQPAATATAQLQPQPAAAQSKSGSPTRRNKVAKASKPAKPAKAAKSDRSAKLELEERKAKEEAAQRAKVAAEARQAAEEERRRSEAAALRKEKTRKRNAEKAAKLRQQREERKEKRRLKREAVSKQATEQKGDEGGEGGEENKQPDATVEEPARASMPSTTEQEHAKAEARRARRKATRIAKREENERRREERRKQRREAKAQATADGGDNNNGVSPSPKIPMHLFADTYQGECLRPFEASNYRAAGVLPYRYDACSDGALCILMGVETNRALGLLGGKRDPTDADAPATAWREFWEESGKLLDDQSGAELRQLEELGAGNVMWFKDGKYALFAFEMLSNTDIVERFRAQPIVDEMVQLYWVRADSVVGQDTAAHPITADGEALHVKVRPFIGQLLRNPAMTAMVARIRMLSGATTDDGVAAGATMVDNSAGVVDSSAGTLVENKSEEAGDGQAPGNNAHDDDDDNDNDNDNENENENDNNDNNDNDNNENDEQNQGGDDQDEEEGE